MFPRRVREGVRRGMGCRAWTTGEADQRAVQGCVQTPALSYALLALQLFGVPVGAQLRAVVRGAGSENKQPKIPCNRL